MALGLSHDGHSPCSRERVDVKIVVLGRAGVGKSSLVEAFVDQRWGTGATASSLTSPTRVSAPTLDVNMAFKDVSLAGHHIRIELWDISGSKVHSDLLTSYYQRARGAFIVFDGRKESFAEVQEWKENFEKLTASQDHPLPVMLIANKDDQWPHLPIVRDENSIADYCIRNKYSGWFATSAHTGLGVASAFLALTARICWPTMSDSELEEILSSTELSSPQISSKRPRGQLFSFPASRGASPLPCPQLDLSPSSSHRLCSSKSSLSTVLQGSLRSSITVTLRESRHACTSCPSQHSSRPSSVASTCSSDSACTHCDTPPTRRSLRLSPGARAGGDTTKSNDTATAGSVFKALLGAGLVGAALAPTYARIAHTTATTTVTATSTSTATATPTTITSTTLAPLSFSAANETQGPIVQSNILDSSANTSANSIHGSQSPAIWATAASPPRHISTAITHTNTRGRVEKIAGNASPQGLHHSPLVPKEHSVRPR